MLISSATTVIVMLALSGSVAHAADTVGGTTPAPTGANGKYRQVRLDSVLHGNLDETAIISLRDRAPIGHRQPRMRDIPATTQLSPVELDLKREDEAIDSKLIICRGC